MTVPAVLNVSMCMGGTTVLNVMWVGHTKRGKVTQ